MTTDVNKIGVPTLSEDDTSLRPEIFDFDATADVATRLANLELKLTEAIAFLNAFEFRYGERFVGEMLVGLKLFGLTFGTTQPNNSTGVASDIFLDYSQDEDVVRTTVQTGAGYEEGVTAIEAALQPLLNRIQSLEASELDGQALSNQLDAIEAEFATINNSVSGTLQASEFTVQNLFDGGNYTLADLKISDALTSTEIAAEILAASDAIRGGAPTDADTLGKLNNLLLAERNRISALEVSMADTTQVTADIQAASDNVLATLRAGVAVDGDTLAKLYNLLVLERTRNDTQQATLDGITDGSSADFDSFVEIFNRVMSGEAEDDAALASLTSMVSGKMEATQAALIAVISEVGGDVNAIRTALGVTSSADLQTELDGKLDEGAQAADSATLEGQTLAQVRDAGELTGTLSADRIDNNSLGFAKVNGLAPALNGFATQQALFEQQLDNLDTSAGGGSLPYADIWNMTIAEQSALGYVTLAGYGGGQFEWRDENLSTLVSEQEIVTGAGNGRIVIAPQDGRSGASGAFVRSAYRNGATIKAEWWGIEPSKDIDFAPSFRRMLKAAFRLQSIEIITGGHRIGSALEFGTGDYRLASAINEVSPADAFLVIKGQSGLHSRLVGDAGIVGRLVHIENRVNQLGRTARIHLQGLSFLTKSENGETTVGFSMPELEGGTSKGWQQTIVDCRFEGFDRRFNYFSDCGLDMSGTHRVIVEKCFAAGIWGPGLDPADNIQARDDDSLLFKMKAGYRFDGCYDVQWIDCETSSAEAPFTSRQGASTDANGVRKGYAEILGIANQSGGTQMRAFVDGPNHGFSIGDMVRLSAGTNYQRTAVQIVNITSDAVNNVLIFDVPFAGNVTGHILQISAGGEGFKAIRSRALECKTGPTLVFAGREASAYLEKECHWNVRDRGAYVDGAQQIEIENGKIYNGGFSTDGPGRFVDYDFVNMADVFMNNCFGRFAANQSLPRTLARFNAGENASRNIRIDKAHALTGCDEAFQFFGNIDKIRISNFDDEGMTSGDLLANFRNNLGDVVITQWHPKAGVSFLDTTPDGVTTYP